MLRTISWTDNTDEKTNCEERWMILYLARSKIFQSNNFLKIMFLKLRIFLENKTENIIKENEIKLRLIILPKWYLE